MKSWWLSGSLALNLGLCLALVWLLARPGSKSDSIAPPPPAPTAPERSAQADPSADLKPAAAPKPFHWSAVESTNYLAYIANLRAIGCPEQTIRDIIIADVNSLFASRYAALSQSVPELAWWGRYDSRKPLRAELAAQLRELNDEKKALLIRLLGEDATKDLVFADTHLSAYREQNTFAFLPESKRDRVRDLVRRYESWREWSESAWKSLSSDERDAKEKELRAAREQELAAILTPEEMREFALRDSLTAESIREQYGRGNLTEEEFRKLYELRKDFEQTHPQTQPEDWKALDANYANVLGPERFGDLQRQNDSMWRALQNLASENGFSSDAMSQAFAIKQEYTDKLVQAVGQMFADPERNPQPLRDLAAEMDARLGGVLGPEAVKQLDRLGVLPRLVVQDDGNTKSYSFSRGD